MHLTMLNSLSRILLLVSRVASAASDAVVLGENSNGRPVDMTTHLILIFRARSSSSSLSFSSSAMCPPLNAQDGSSSMRIPLRQRMFLRRSYSGVSCVSPPSLHGGRQAIQPTQFTLLPSIVSSRLRVWTRLFSMATYSVKPSLTRRRSMARGKPLTPMVVAGSS